MQRGLGGFPHERLHQDTVLTSATVQNFTSPRFMNAPCVHTTFRIQRGKKTRPSSILLIELYIVIFSHRIYLLRYKFMDAGIG
ncbi:hypothetical protein [Moorena sp. SIO3E8]|uniref:hypothetical protein n=1 Tax=Moorena sp. SIO3E8 TaxID=2607830 RepID=UPI0014187EDB|nr:hypothetical protein [Moorena sp. SIO3E8]NEO15351.1 hypothetical protein [Moorena sp. SIO3E8]